MSRSQWKNPRRTGRNPRPRRTRQNLHARIPETRVATRVGCSQNSFHPGRAAHRDNRMATPLGGCGLHSTSTGQENNEENEHGPDDHGRNQKRHPRPSPYLAGLPSRTRRNPPALSLSPGRGWPTPGFRGFLLRRFLEILGAVRAITSLEESNGPALPEIGLPDLTPANVAVDDFLTHTTPGRTT